MPQFIVPMKTIFHADNPLVLAMREPPLSPVEDTPSSGFDFDDKDVVVNASFRGLERGVSLPLLLDLARKPNFLHDNSVPDLDTLLNPSRGLQAPHPFFLPNANDRSDVAEFLRSLDDGAHSGVQVRASAKRPIRGGCSW